MLPPLYLLLSLFYQRLPQLISIEPCQTKAFNSIIFCPHFDHEYFAIGRAFTRRPFLSLSLSFRLVLSPLFMYLIICLYLYRCSLPASFVCRQRSVPRSTLASTYETSRESAVGLWEMERERESEGSRGSERGS